MAEAEHEKVLQDKLQKLSAVKQSNSIGLRNFAAENEDLKIVEKTSYENF